MKTSLTRMLGARLLERSGQLLDGLADRLGDISRLANFARGRLEFQVRADDIFIVTYPRSGTTLMQYLLHCLVRGEEASFEHVSQVAPWFERSLAVGALAAADLEALPSPRIFKSHLAYGWLPQGARYIYVTREGRDVAVSYYHFYRSHLRYDGTFEQFFQRFLDGKLQYKSYFKHVAGWQAHAGDPSILFLRFEDLVGDLRGCIERIAAFCQLAVPDSSIAAAIAACSFERMKQQEQRFDFSTEFLLQRGFRPRSFLRRGQSGESQAMLSAAQQQAFARAAQRTYRRPDLELDLPQFLR